MDIQELNLQIKNIYQDIVDNELDLKPEFQRGEVWASNKKKLLIDSILRDWHIPPLHLVELKDKRCEVLDGQQRLSAIRDFINNKFAIDGSIEPYSDVIANLDNLRYRDLPRDVKRNVDQFALKIYKIRNYQNGEPNELFHRLNQTVKLTSAETRNSIFGVVRNDISELVKYMEINKVDASILGFSNSRMSYNDMLCRVAILLEKNSLKYQLSEANLNARYRKDESFSNEIQSAIRFTIDVLFNIKNHIQSEEITLNLTKASSLSWIFLISESYLNGKISNSNDDHLIKSFLHIETVKSDIRRNEKLPVESILFLNFNEHTIRELAFLYLERSSSRVMSIGSLLVRDIIINISCARGGLSLFNFEMNSKLQSLIEGLEQSNTEDGSEIKFLIENFIETWRCTDESI